MCSGSWVKIQYFLTFPGLLPSPGAPELCDGDITRGAVHPGPRAGHQGDGGNVARHARPGGLLQRGAAGPSIRLPLLPLIPHTFNHREVRGRNTSWGGGV